MTYRYLRYTVNLTIALALVLQPISYAYSQDAPGNLAPDNVFAKVHFTPESDQFSRSVLSDMEFFSFAVYAHKQIVREGKNAGELLESLKDLPYWRSGRLKAYLAKDFLDRSGDILRIKFRNGNAVRVFPAFSHVTSDNGAIEDGIVPRFSVTGDKYTIQYIDAASAPNAIPVKTEESGVQEGYQRVWEKALPYYEKARPADILHVSWMIREASRIARAEGLDARILLPIVILHDVGYAACMSDEHARAFETDVKIKHMREGAKIARTILSEIGYDPALTEKIVRYVSVHDNWKIGDNSPFKECREMAVFQDLDFTWMATREGFESARTQILNKSPREMYDFLVTDEKHELRPFATGGTASLFASLMGERKRDLDLAGGHGQTMIGFGPVLNYTALKISSDMKGIYITTEEKAASEGKPYIEIVCKTEEGASEKAVKIAEMLNQVLQLMNLTITQEPEIASLTEIARDFDRMKSNISRNKVYVESSSNLKANSARYWLEAPAGKITDPDHFVNKIVFNDRLINILYDMWVSHRTDATPEKWTEEVGAIWMVAERLFHELDHDSDEIAQIRKDRLFYITIVRKCGFVQRAIKFDASMDVRYNGGARTAPFGEAFGGNAYFHMIHRISEMNNEREIRAEIRKYLEETFRRNSGRQALKLPESKIEFAVKMLREHGISDDVFGEAMMGKPFSEFFMERCMFTRAAPYDYPYVTQEQERFKNDLCWHTGIRKLTDILISVGRSVGDERRIRTWIANCRGSNRLTGRNVERRKLFPVIAWAATVVHPQNYQLRSGKLFDETYYEGLNLMTIPIFPLDKQGNIDWELLSWIRQRPPTHSDKERGPPRFGVPSEKYFRAVKISLYEFLVTHDIPEAEVKPDASGVSSEPEKSAKMYQPGLFDQLPQTGGKNTQTQDASSADDATAPAEKRLEEVPRQLTLFDMDVEQPVTGVDEAGNVAAPEEDGEPATIETGIKDIHSLTMEIDVAPTVDKMTHVLIERSIPAESQREILTAMNKRSRGALVSEKIYFMDAEAIAKYISDNRCTRENTVVLLADDSRVEQVGGNVNMLVVKKDGVTDFVNIEGLLGAARCVLNRDWDSFRDIYSALTGAECPEIKPEWLADPVELAKHLIITLPPVSIINVDEQKKYNEMLREAMVAA